MTSPTISFEFFPPRTDVQARRFWRTLGCLETLSPSWVSVTYGALGSASQASLDVVGALGKDTSVPVAAHLTCGGQTAEELNKVLDELEGLGIKRIVALRGDSAAEAEQSQSGPVLQHASELVELLAARPHIDVSVAAYPEVHPEADNAESDLYWLKTKLDAGASRALTQFFFEADVFLRWRDRAARYGIDKPLVPGILPIHDIEKVVDFSGRCGAHVPASIVKRFNAATDPQSRRSLAIEQCVELCRQLRKEGVNDFHLYTLNQSDLAYAVSRELCGQGKRVARAEPVAA